jgi:hypothetical protein
VQLLAVEAPLLRLVLLLPDQRDQRTRTRDEIGRRQLRLGDGDVRGCGRADRRTL